jgi:hypothetical protein
VDDSRSWARSARSRTGSTARGRDAASAESRQPQRGSRALVIGGTLAVAPHLSLVNMTAQRTLEVTCRSSTRTSSDSGGPEGRPRRPDRRGDLRGSKFGTRLRRREPRTAATPPLHNTSPTSVTHQLQGRRSLEPDVNIRYGTFSSLQSRSSGTTRSQRCGRANAGETNVVAWGGSSLRLDDIAFPKPHCRECAGEEDEYARHYHELRT